jgi:hypothetical protein
LDAVMSSAAERRVRKSRVEQATAKRQSTGIKADLRIQ